jgi:methionyl-tRNA synthetase
MDVKIMKIRIITAALPYANNIPHLGHLLGSHLPADIFARYSRLIGYQVYFVGGTDENGAATEFAAIKENISPRELCDKYFLKHKELYENFNISYDNFSRTSKEIHHKLVKEFFLNLYKNGFIKEKVIKQAYDNIEKKGLPDRFIKGTCPHCNYEYADGDQCENCGSVLTPAELINPYSALNGSKDIVFKEIKHLFLDISSAIDNIEKWIDNNSLLREWIKGLAKGWINNGIKQRDITRELSWGVKIPLKGYEDKVFYVWFDNVIGYISSTADLLGEQKAIELWKNPDVENYYFVGKDNIPFHTIFWPGQIIGDKRFNLPTAVMGYHYLNFKGSKFSKSKNNGIFLDMAINSKIPIDYWRFYLVYILTETSDSEFLIDDFKDRVNKELIGNFGNYVNRVLNFIFNRLDGNIPKVIKKDENLEKKINDFILKIKTSYDKIEIRQALYNCMKLSDLGNRYLNEKEPWKSKEYSSLAYSTEIIRILSTLLSPIIPNSTEKIFEFLNTNNKSLEINLEERKINTPSILFSKLEDSDLEKFKIKEI